MRYQEAQQKSVSGVAVWGNEIMQDVIWPKDSAQPFMFMQDGYIPIEPGKYLDSEAWSPLHWKRGERPPIKIRSPNDGRARLSVDSHGSEDLG